MSVHSGSGWIRSALKINMSPLGEKVADLLGDCFSGIYHLDQKSLEKVNWSNDLFVAINLPYRSLSTFDSPHLTWLVVLCHDRCLRMDVTAKTINTLELMFHQRQRDGGVSERHPTIEAHIEHIRKYYPLPVAVSG